MKKKTELPQRCSCWITTMSWKPRPACKDCNGTGFVKPTVQS